MSSRRNNTSFVKFETHSHVVKEENQGLVLLLSFFLISATLFGLPSDESNFTVDEFGKRHYVLIAENTNTSFLEKLSAIVSGRYSLEHKIFDYDDLTIDSESILLLPFVFSSLLYFELGRGNGKFVPLGIIVFRFANSKPTTLIFLLVSDFFKNITREHSKNKILLLSIFAVLILATPQFYQKAYGAEVLHYYEENTTCASTSVDNTTLLEVTDSSDFDFISGRKYLVIVQSQFNGDGIGDNVGLHVTRGGTEVADSNHVIEPSGTPPSDRGGHCGFIQGLSLRSWVEDYLADQCEL